MTSIKKRFEAIARLEKIAYLSIFFIPFSDGRCRIIKEEIGEEIVKKYRTKVICG